jgi:hypothetical protein
MKKGNLNAIQHGAFSQMIILPGEDREEFDALHSALREEWDPQGPTQEDKVFNIAQNMWRKRQMGRRRKKLAEIGEDEIRRERWERDSLLKFLDDVDDGKPRSELKLPKRWFEYCKERYARKNYDSDDALLEAVYKEVDSISNTLLFHCGKASEQVITDPLCSHDAIARDLALEERIDAKIDKDIVALGRMKTMQSMGLGRRRKEPASEDQAIEQIDSPPIEPEPLTEELPKGIDTR